MTFCKCGADVKDGLCIGCGQVPERCEQFQVELKVFKGELTKSAENKCPICGWSPLMVTERTVNGVVESRVIFCEDCGYQKDGLR